MASRPVETVAGCWARSASGNGCSTCHGSRPPLGQSSLHAYYTQIYAHTSTIICEMTMLRLLPEPTREGREGSTCSYPRGPAIGTALASTRRSRSHGWPDHAFAEPWNDGLGSDRLDSLPASSELGVDVGLVEGDQRLTLQIYRPLPLDKAIAPTRFSRQGAQHALSEPCGTGSFVQKQP